MPTELEELVGFIANPSQQIRLVAIENLVPYSTSQPDVFKADKFVPIKNLKLLVKDHPVSIFLNFHFLRFYPLLIFQRKSPNMS